MSNYTKSTNFATKDSLISGNPLKIVKGTEIDTEFNNLAIAIATKKDTTAIEAVATGGTGQSSYTNGQLLIGNSTGNTLTKAKLTAGSGITILNGAGSITISSSGGGGGGSDVVSNLFLFSNFGGF